MKSNYGERFIKWEAKKEKKADRKIRKKEARPRPSQMKKRSDEQRAIRSKIAFQAKVQAYLKGKQESRVPCVDDDMLGNQNGNVLMLAQRASRL